MLAELTITEFLKKTGSGDPVPGGGSVAALGAALSAALGAMVARLTLEKSGDPEVKEQMAAMVERLVERESALARSIDDDSDAYREVMKAYRLPKSTDGEKAVREKAIEDGLIGAARIPMTVAATGLELLEIAGRLVKVGRQSAVTDAAVGALMARSAILGALLNVRINLASVRDAGFVSYMEEEADRIEKRTRVLEDEILLEIRAMMEKGG